MLEQDFIEVLLRLVRIVEQDTRIANQLLLPRHADIDGTLRHCVTALKHNRPRLAIFCLSSTILNITAEILD